MVQGSIFRKQTDEEKVDFKEIKSKDFQHEFRQKLIKKEQEYVKAHKPFCFRCAKLDFESKVTDRITEAGRVSGDLSLEQLKTMKIDTSHLDDYGKPEIFTKFKDDKDVIENKVIDGIRSPFMVGTNESYKCKKRGCVRIVFVPLVKIIKKAE